jgi:hypothetical protein
LAVRSHKGDVGHRNRVGSYALFLDAHVDAKHLLPQALDIERILANQRWLESRSEIRMHRISAAAVENHAVAQAARALVG